METRTVLPIRAALAVLALACGVAGAAQNNDFAALKAHWSFDEGRDWHNMAQPYQCTAAFATELTGKSDDMLLNEEMTSDNAAWV